MNDFGLELRKIRIRAGYTQQAFADKIGVPAATYKSWEYGTALPSFTNRDKLCNQYPELKKLWEKEKI